MQSAIEVTQSKDKKLHIIIDPTVGGDLSKSGKSQVLASTHGFTVVNVGGKDLRISLNVIRALTGEEKAAVEAAGLSPNTEAIMVR